MLPQPDSRGVNHDAPPNTQNNTHPGNCDLVLIMNEAFIPEQSKEVLK